MCQVGIIKTALDTHANTDLPHPAVANSQLDISRSNEYILTETLHEEYAVRSILQVKVRLKIEEPVPRLSVSLTCEFRE